MDSLVRVQRYRQGTSGGCSYLEAGATQNPEQSGASKTCTDQKEQEEDRTAFWQSSMALYSSEAQNTMLSMWLSAISRIVN